MTTNLGVQPTANTASIRFIGGGHKPGGASEVDEVRSPVPGVMGGFMETKAFAEDPLILTETLQPLCATAAVPVAVGA
jgi:hypothetical protein